MSTQRTVITAYSTLAQEIQALEVRTPETQPQFVVALPHSGLYLPCDFPETFLLWPSLADESDVGAEDIFDLTTFGAVVIKSNIHRNALDLNRTNKTGTKTIFNRYYKEGREGRPKYMNPQEPLSEQDDRPFYPEIHQKYYVPFYERLQDELDSVGRANNGKALLISGHTFGRAGEETPDICIGTGDMKNVRREIVNGLSKHLSQQAKVSVDVPFKGEGGVSGKFGRPNEGHHALHIEVNRRLFMGETGIKLAKIRGWIGSAVKHVLPMLRGCSC